MNRFIILALFLSALTACNTIDGVGKDIEKAGEAVQRSTK